MPKKLVPLCGWSPRPSRRLMIVSPLASSAGSITQRINGVLAPFYLMPKPKSKTEDDKGGGGAKKKKLNWDGTSSGSDHVDTL